MKPIAIWPQPSRMLHAAVAGMHLLAMLVIIGLSWRARLSLSAAILPGFLVTLSAGWYWRRGKGWAARPLQVNARGILTVDGGKGWEEAEVLPSSVVAPGLTVLRVRLKVSGECQYWLVLPDAVDAENYRELRVWLKWGRKKY